MKSSLVTLLIKFMNRWSITLVGVGLLILGGCGGHQGESAATRPHEGEVLVRCAAMAYSRSEWDREVLASVSLAGKSPRRAGKAMDARTREKVEGHARTTCLMNAVNYLLVKSSAAGRRLDADEAHLKRVQDRYSREVFRKDGKYGNLAGLVSGEEFQAIDAVVRRTAVVERFLAEVMSPRFKVSEAEIDEAWSNVVKQAALADATNSVLMATARDVVRRARAGEDFTSLVHAYTQDVNSDADGYVEEKTEMDFSADKPGVWAVVSRLNVGDVSDPLDSEEGLSIFRLARIEPPNEEHDENWRILQRIVFHRMLKYPYKTRDELAVALREDARRRMGVAAIRELVAENPVSFPSGLKGFSRETLLMLRAYSKEIVVPKAKGLSGAMFKALGNRTRTRGRKKHAHE